MAFESTTSEKVKDRSKMTTRQIAEELGAVYVREGVIMPVMDAGMGTGIIEVEKEKKMSDEKCAENRQPRNIELDQAIIQLTKTTEYLDDLLREITGQSTPKDEKEKERDKPSLSAMLHQGPDRIRKEAERIRITTDEIRNLLF